MTSYSVTRPVLFAGTTEERNANYNSHHFVCFDGEETRCVYCDSRPSHEAASYPCGADVPRETVEFPAEKEV